MRVSVSDGRRLLEAAGVKGVDTMSTKKVLVKLRGLPTLGAPEPDDDSDLELFHELARAVEAGEEVELELPEEEEVTSVEEEPKKTKKVEKTEKKVKVARSGNGREKKVKAVVDRDKPYTPRGDGVIATIVNVLSKASENKPVSKDKILETLVEKFPDRKPGGMAITVGAQVYYQLPRKGVDVRKNEKGFWIHKDSE